MITPAGKECRFFYGDYHRGHHTERCRLLEDQKLDWAPYMCEKCPVPEILQANACEFQQLNPKMEKALFFLRPEVQVHAYCSKCTCAVDEPRIGCGQCHPLPQVFMVSPNEK